MLKKLLIAFVVIIAVLLGGIGFGLPRYANYKLHDILSDADTASYSNLAFDFWKGNVELNDLYVVDTSGSLTKQPLRLNIKHLAVVRFNIWKLLTSHVAQADSIVISQARIEMPLPEKDSTVTESASIKEPKKGFIQSIRVGDILFDSVRVNILLDRENNAERMATTILADASNVSIPINGEGTLGWVGDLFLEDIFVQDNKGRLAKKPMNLNLNRFAVIGLNANDLQQNHTISIDSVLLGRGSFAIQLVKKDSAAADSTKNETPMLESLLLSYVQIDSIATNFDFNPKNANERVEATIAFEASKVSIPFSDNAPLGYENMELNITNIYVQPHKSIAYYQVKNLGYSSIDSSLQINELKMRQRISETKYAKHFGWDKAYMKMDVYQTIIYGLPHELRRLKDGMHFRKISVLGLQSYMYKDKRLPHPTKLKKWALESLAESKIPVRIDTIKVTDSQLFYNENWREDYIPGKLSLTDINVTITNVNSSGPTENGAWTIMKGEIVLLDELKLSLDWRFDLRKKCKSFTLDLGIGKTPFEAMNPFTENTMGLHFKSGNLNGGRMLVEADKKSGTGTLDLYYEDMKLDIINKQSHEKNFWGWAAGGLANWVVRNNNIENKRPKQGIVYAEPQLDRAIFGYVVKMFFSGFQDLALTSKNEKKAKGGKSSKKEKK